MTNNVNTIAILGEDISTTQGIHPIEQLKFLPDNPRVYAVIREMEDFDQLTPDEKQIKIYHCLLNEPSVKKLIPEIKRDRGLQEPIIVRWDTQEVIEGNSRLAVYRKLNYDEPDNEAWKKIRCQVVGTLTDEQQTRILGQIHLHGKTEWSPYAKALYCYRWVVEQDKESATLSEIAGFSKQEIKTNISIIKLMMQNNEINHSRYSYYDVLVRNRTISTKINENETLRKEILTRIKTEEFTAQQLRDKLPTIIKKPKILKKFQNGELLNDAFDRAKISGAEHKLKKIRQVLDDIEKEDIISLERPEANAMEYEINKIQSSLKRVSKMVENCLQITTPIS